MPSRAQTALILLVVAAQQSAAEELCVVCNDPPATYRCDQGNGPATGPGLQLSCIKQLAQRGGHQSCTIDRTRAGAPCNGLLVTLDPAAADTAPAPVAIAPSSGSNATPAQTALPAPIPAQPKDAPPATVEALAKQTAEQSQKEWEETNAKVKETTQAAGQNLKKAGGAVGEAVKKSWDCVVSLFSAC